MSLKSYLLAASLQLTDPNFTRSVVLLIEHSDEGALGVVLNRPTDKSIEEMWREIGEGRCACQGRVYLGGPVPGPLLALHDQRDLGEIEVVSGVFFSSSKDNLAELVQRPIATLKVFLGHAGWGGGQLEGELEEGAWHAVPATDELVFNRDDTVWLDVTRQVGKQTLLAILGLKDVPEDPSVN